MRYRYHECKKVRIIEMLRHVNNPYFLKQLIPETVIQTKCSNCQLNKSTEKFDVDKRSDAHLEDLCNVYLNNIVFSMFY